MMARVTIRGLTLCLCGLLAISIAGCAEEPEQAPTVAQTVGVGEVVHELDIHLPGSKGGADRGDPGRGLDLPREGNRALGSPEEGEAKSAPGADRTEPDPVPWVPRYAVAGDA